MIAAAALVVGLQHSSSAERVYRVTATGTPGTAITLRAQVASGWIAAFCTVRVCARGSVSTLVPRNGVVHAGLHLYRDALRASATELLVSDSLGHRRVLQLRD